MNYFHLILHLAISAASENITFDRIPETNSPPAPRFYLTMDFNSITQQIIIFGGLGNIGSNFNDIWTFDIADIHYHHLVPTNDLVPEARINAGSFVDEEANCFYVFGGKTARGPSNEMWKFELTGLKWYLIEPQDLVPQPLHSFAYCKDVAETLRIFVHGGININGQTNETWMYLPGDNEWKNLTDDSPDESEELLPLISASIVVYEEMLYIAAGERFEDQKPIMNSNTYRINISTAKSEKLKTEATYVPRILAGSALYKSSFFIFFGWSTLDSLDLNSTIYLNLSQTDSLEWKVFDNKSCEGKDSFGYSLVNDSLYIFGGFYIGDSTNQLEILDLRTHKCKRVNDELQTPPARMYQSMLGINGKLYMYGGRGLTARLDDMWVFDISAEEWSSIKTSGTSPGSRSSHASASQGDIMIIWGGVSDSSFLNDLYKFEANLNTWTKIEPSGTLPSGKRGACMKVLLPKIYIFGGESLSGLTNELWEYDTAFNVYTQIAFNGNSQPAPVKYPVCEMFDSKLFVAFGASEGEEPVCTIYSFNLTERTWIEEESLPLYNNCRTVPAAHFINSRYLVYIGGEVWGTDASKTAQVIDIANEFALKNYGTEEFFFAGASAVIGSKIYMFGGGTSVGNTIRLSIPSYNFYSINLTSFGIDGLVVCSLGTYRTDGGCKSCPAGSYADKEDQTTCTKCKEGTYNNIDGASSDKQCYPCPDGSYNPKNGSKVCYDCPIGASCPVGSKNFSIVLIEESLGTSQPASYKPDTISLNNKKTMLYGIVISLGFIACASVLLIKQIKDNLKILDLFKIRHNYEIGSYMKMEKNSIGGFFGILFLIVAIILIIIACLDYSYNNIIESKALVPLVLLSSEIEAFTGNLTAKVTLFNYGGDCDDKTDSFSVEFSNLNKDDYTRKLTKDGSACIIEIEIINCEVETGASMKLKLEHQNSYCSDIRMTLTSTSSIEDTTSMITEIIHADENKVFRGYTPTYFNLLLFPSLYQPEDSSKDYTGYHVSISSNAVKGTMYTINELPFSSNLLVAMNLIRSSNGLYTKRYYNQTLLALFSTLIGSVFGILGFIGGMMKLYEGNYFRFVALFKSRNRVPGLASRNYKLKEEIGVQLMNHGNTDSFGSLVDISIEN